MSCVYWIFCRTIYINWTSAGWNTTFAEIHRLTWLHEWWSSLKFVAEFTLLKNFNYTSIRGSLRTEARMQEPQILLKSRSLTPQSLESGKWYIKYNIMEVLRSGSGWSATGRDKYVIQQNYCNWLYSKAIM